VSDAPFGLDHVGLVCADLERALDFYVARVGLVLRARGESQVLAGDEPGAHYGWADLELPDGRVVELIAYPEPGESLPPPAFRRPGGGHFALRVADLRATLARLAHAGVEPLAPPTTIAEPGAWEGATIAYVADPDGHALELVEWPRSEDGSASV
jgi:lactoylglutathione lyase